MWSSWSEYHNWPKFLVVIALLCLDSVDARPKGSTGDSYDVGHFQELATKLPHFNSHVALGDSYSSGDGAIDGWGSGTCRRNHGSYSSRLNKLLHPGSFHFLACSGADISHIIKKQVNNKAYGAPDLVTVTAGGDNGGIFVKILLACLLHKRSKECDKALKHAEKTIEGLPMSLAPMYSAIKKKAEGASNPVKIVHIGYVQLYNRDKDKSQCPEYKFHKGVDLTWATIGDGGYRDKINKIILKVNSKIKESADKAGITYVDVDPYFEGHRLCDGPNDSWMQHKLNFGTGGILAHPTFDGHTAYMNATLHALLGEKA